MRRQVQKCEGWIEKGADRGAEAISARSGSDLSLCFYLVGVAGFEPATPLVPNEVLYRAAWAPGL
jgi:hypothetical protein